MVSSFIGLLDIQSWWEIPCIAHFCSLFSSAFNLPDIDIEDFEAALLTDGTDDSVGLLPELIVRLLKGCDTYKTKHQNDITTSSYQMFLRRLFRNKCQEHNIVNYFDTDTDFQSLPVRNKLLILHSLCHFRLESDDVLYKFSKLEADSLRVEPLGYDSKNSGYWYFFGTRLYREDIKPQTNTTVWQVICFTENDWINLATKFKNSKNKKERALLDILVQNFLPKLPHLFREKEKLRRRKLFQARNSARIRSYVELKEKQLKEKQLEIERVEEDRQKKQIEQQALNRTTKRRRSQSTSTASGISTYGSSIRPSINSSDFLYKREKFCLSPGGGTSSVSSVQHQSTNVVNHPPLFSTTPPSSSSQSPLKNIINNNFNEIEKELLEDEEEEEEDDIAVQQDDEDIYKSAEEYNSSEEFKEECKTEKENILEENQLVEITTDRTLIIHKNYYNKNDDSNSISSVEEDKENFIYFKRSNTSDSSDSAESEQQQQQQHSVKKKLTKKLSAALIKRKKITAKKPNSQNIMAPTTNMKLPGRQTNNSLSSLSGNIFLPPFEGGGKVTKNESTKAYSNSNKKEKSISSASSTSSSVTSNMAATSSSQSSSNADGNSSSNKKKKSKSNEIGGMAIKKVPTTLPAITLNYSHQQQQPNPFLSFTETDEVLQIGMHKVLVHVKNHRDAWPFMDPVEEDIAPRYYSIIRRPMDLLKMEDKLDNGEYKKFSEFRNDFKLIVNNCRLYNGQNNEYTEMVNNLQEAFEKATKKYFDHYSDDDDEINLGYPDTKLNVFREKSFNKSSSALETLANRLNKDGKNNDCDVDNDEEPEEDEIDVVNTKISKKKDKEKYKESSSSSKHHHKSNDEDDINIEDASDLEVQNDLKTSKRKRKEKDKRRKKKMKLESSKYERDEIISGNNSNDDDADDDDSKSKQKKSKRIDDLNGTNKRTSLKKVDVKTKDLKVKNKNDSDVTDAHSSGKKLKVRSTNKASKVKKSKADEKYIDRKEDASNRDQKYDNRKIYDYSSDNSTTDSAKLKNFKQRSSLNLSSISSSQKYNENNSTPSSTSASKTISTSKKHEKDTVKSKKEKRHSGVGGGGGGKDTLPNKVNKKEEIDKKKKSTGKNQKILDTKTSSSKSKQHHNKIKSHNKIAKKYSNERNSESDKSIVVDDKVRDDDDEDEEDVSGTKLITNDGDDDAEDSLASESRSSSPIFKVDLHKKYANSASLDDDLDIVFNEKNKSKTNRDNFIDDLSKKIKSSHKLSKQQNKDKKFKSIDNDNNSQNQRRTPSPSFEQELQSSGSKTSKHDDKNSKKSSKNKSKSKKSKNIENSPSASDAAVTSPRTSKRDAEPNIKADTNDLSVSQSLLFLDKYDLIKQRRNRANNTASTTEEKWNQIVKEAAEKNKDNKKSSSSKQNYHASNTSNKDKNQKLKETIEKLKAKNQKSKERSVLIDEIFGVKPSKEVRDEKAIFEKLRETCSEPSNNKKGNTDKTSTIKKATETTTPSKVRKSHEKPNAKESGKDLKKKDTKQNDKKPSSRKQGNIIAPPAPVGVPKKKSQPNSKTNMEALELETEQTLKDINRWLEHTPRFSEFSSASNSPTRYNLLDDFDTVAAKLDPSDFRRPDEQATTISSTNAILAPDPSTKSKNNEPKLAETFEEIATSNSAKISKSPNKAGHLDEFMLSTQATNKTLLTVTKEEISQSSSNATINSNSNQSSLSALLPKTKEPSTAQLLPHPPPPPPHIKSQLQKEAKRKTLKEKFTGNSAIRRKDNVRTIDRFQPGKSKGNLLSNSKASTNNNANNSEDLFALSSSAVSKFKEIKNSLVVKTDESAPKLSLGSVLNTEGFGLGQLHNFGDEIACGELKISEAITSGDENDDKKKIDNLTVSSSSPSDCGSKDAISLADDKTKTDDLKDSQMKVESESESGKAETKTETKSSTSATPNLSAWFKAFGAPKKTKKQEEEEAAVAAAALAKKNENLESTGDAMKSVSEQASNNNFNNMKSPNQTSNENFSLPAPRQRKASTGSTISERSSFSQDPDSPRIGIDDRFGAYQGPYASPIGASPIMVSPKPDEIIKPTSPYPLNGAIKVGFYQDTTTKSSPEKSCSPRELPSPAYPQYSQHIYSSTSPNVNAEMSATTPPTTANTTSPYGAGGSGNGSGNSSTNANCYNPSVDPNKTPSGSGYSPTSPVTPATPNLYEQYKQPHSQESDYNSSMSPSTNPNSPYQQNQNSPYQHHPNSPYQQNSNQNSPYQQPHSPYQQQSQTSSQSSSLPAVSTSNSNNSKSNNNSSGNKTNSSPMSIAMQSPGNNSQTITQPLQSTQQNEMTHSEQNSPYQQTSNLPYQQQSMQPSYQKNSTSPYHQSIPSAHQSVPSTQQHTMNFSQQPSLDNTQQQQQNQQRQPTHDLNQQKQIPSNERQQYSTDAQSRYPNMLENSNNQQYQQQSVSDQWKNAQSTTSNQNSHAMNLQQQNPMNSLNVVDQQQQQQQQQQQMHSMNQMQQEPPKSTAMQYPTYPHYTPPTEKDNLTHKSQIYNSELTNHLLQKSNPANILNPLNIPQPPNQQHPPKRPHTDSTGSSTLMNLGYSEPNPTMSDPKIPKRNEQHQQIDKMYDPNNAAALNKHQQMFDSFLGSMASGKNLSFSKPMDIGNTKAYDMFNKTTPMNYHNKDYPATATATQSRMQSTNAGKELNIPNSVNNTTIQHNMTNINQVKPIDNNGNSSAYQQQLPNINSQNQQQQVPSSIYSATSNSGNTGKHPQSHPTNYSQNLPNQSQHIGGSGNNTNDKNHLIIPNPRQDQMSNINRNMDLTSYKASSFNNPSVSGPGLLDPLRNINHSMAMMDESGMLGLSNTSLGGGGYYDKSMPPAAHMFSKTLPQQIYQNPSHYGMVSSRDQQNPPPPGNYVPSSNVVGTNMSAAALQMDQQQIVEPTKPKRGKKKKNASANEMANSQLQNSLLSASQSHQLQAQQLQQQQQQHLQMSHHNNSNTNNVNNTQNMLSSSNQSAVQAAAVAAAAHHQGFQLYAGLKNAVAAASSPGGGNNTGITGGSNLQSSNPTDVSAISLKTASAAASMVSAGSPFNFGPSPTGLGIPTGIYDNSSYLDEFRGANPYYMPASHRVTPDPTAVSSAGGIGNANNSGSGVDKSVNANNTNAAASASAAAAAAASPYHQFLSHQAATQRSSYSFMNTPQLDPNSPLYSQYMRPTPEELRARMMHSLLPGATGGYSQAGYRPPPTHLGLPKPYDVNRNPWF